MTHSRTRHGRLVIGGALLVLSGVLAGCGGSATPTQTTDALGGTGISTEPSTTTIAAGSSSKLVDVLWGTDGSGNLMSAFPSDGEVAKGWGALIPGRSFRANLTLDAPGDATDPLTQAAEAQGGGAWQRSWVVTDQNDLREAVITVTVAVLGYSGKTEAVLAASRAGVPAGTESVTVPGAPVSATANRWLSTDGGMNVHLDAYRSGTVVRCRATGSSADPSSVCGAMAGYLLDIIGDARVPS